MIYSCLGNAVILLLLLSSFTEKRVICFRIIKMLWQPAENRSKYRPQFSHPHDIELLDEQGNPKHFKIIFGLL
jgi:hypothetical protein